ncbi:MAG: YIP1 family protein [Chloroflexota bacterium]
MQPMIRPAGTGDSLVSRMIGVSTLSRPVFSDIRRDVDATTQALIVVAIAAIAAGIGAIGSNQPGIVWQVIMAVIGWIVFSVVAFLIGSLFASRDQHITLGQVLRLVGFAQAPKVIGALGFIPLVGWFAGLIAGIWFLVCAIYALREAFNVSTISAVLIGLISGAVVFGVTVLVGTVFNLAGNVLSWLF